MKIAIFYSCALLLSCLSSDLQASSIVDTIPANRIEHSIKSENRKLTKIQYYGALTLGLGFTSGTLGLVWGVIEFTNNFGTGILDNEPEKKERYQLSEIFMFSGAVLFATGLAMLLIKP